MNNIIRENSFEDTYGTVRDDIPYIGRDNRRISDQIKQNECNEKRRKMRRIGFDYMDENYIEENSIDIDRIVINKNFITNKKGIRSFEVFYDEKPLIVKVTGKANLLVKGGDYKYIQLYMDSLDPTFSDFICELNSDNFINRILEGENFYPSTKYSITGSNIIIDNEIDTIEGSLKVKIDESSGNTFTPFMPIENFNDHINLIYPTSKNDLNILPKRGCKVICYLHFSNITPTNSSYTFTIFCKKCGYEVI